MRHRRDHYRVGVLAGVLVAVVWSGWLSAQGTEMPTGDHILAEVKGEFRKVAVTGGDHTAFQITAVGLTWEVDIPADKKLMDRAERLAGSVAVVTGTYAERKSGPHVRRIITAQAVDAGDSEPSEYLDVTVHGTLNTGVMAIGAETTGVTVTAGTVTWELELDGRQHAIASELSGSTAIISGQLTHQGGVERRGRFIVRVKHIQSK